MQGLLTQLKKVLRAEAGLYRKLLKVLRAERAAMTRFRQAEMDAEAARRSRLLTQIEAQEKRRVTVLNELAVRLHRPVASLTLAFLAGQDEAHGDTLRHLRLELGELVAQVREESRRSEMLCRHAAEVVRGSLRLFQGLADTGAVYRPNGRLEGSRRGGRLLRGEL
jgi:flagellar biosynthesis/type III secretory pathway chaperone